VPRPGYEVTFARSARKDLERLGASFVARILSQIEGLAAAPRPPGCRKIRGEEDLWRIRVGDYRVVYSVRDEVRHVDVVAVRHRKDVYR
jgi:mRNA interferase RelE/StbE